MADIKTHLRELSVAVTIGLLKANIPFKQSTLYDPRFFWTSAQKTISGNISSAQNLGALSSFDNELRQIINNGYKLGKKIFDSPHFDIQKNSPIYWLGNNTQKSDPIDLMVGDYAFSLKEESFILTNMGLYAFLNALTGSHYQRGLHVFTTFAPQEYDEWFCYTWQSLISHLTQKGPWSLTQNDNHSRISLSGQKVILSYNTQTASVPTTIATIKEYSHYTSSQIREKVFAKWISATFENDAQYIRLKKRCSEAAGHKLSNKINAEFTPNYLYEFFRLYDKEYYYAKTTPYETTILCVPSRYKFDTMIAFQGCRYDVPASQLNLITTFQNKRTKRQLEFRNECRFSHGQFNGTPEAKMYISNKTSLTDLYDPID